MKKSAIYDKDFYEAVKMTAASSAEVIVPFIMKIAQPETVVDVGCGTGTWLSVFKKYGVQRICGLDGEWVEGEMMQIPKEAFRGCDFKTKITLNEKFDLALSVEVAEHLSPQDARGFVKTLTELAPLVVFSAAVPMQGGTNHVNEQWPDYWMALFKERKFHAVDCFRPRFFSDERVTWWYAQNMFLYVRDGCEGKINLDGQGLSAAWPAKMIHPELFISRAEIARKYERCSDPLAWLGSLVKNIFSKKSSRV